MQARQARRVWSMVPPDRQGWAPDSPCVRALHPHPRSRTRARGPARLRLRGRPDLVEAFAHVPAPGRPYRHARGRGHAEIIRRRIVMITGISVTEGSAVPGRDHWYMRRLAATESNPRFPDINAARILREI